MLLASFIEWKVHLLDLQGQLLTLGGESSLHRAEPAQRLPSNTNSDPNRRERDASDNIIGVLEITWISLPFWTNIITIHSYSTQGEYKLTQRCRSQVFCRFPNNCAFFFVLSNLLIMYIRCILHFIIGICYQHRNRPGKQNLWGFLPTWFDP